MSDKKFTNIFPCDCLIACTIVGENANYYIVDTDEPWGIESMDGKHIFDIGKELLIMED